MRLSAAAASAACLLFPSLLFPSLALAAPVASSLTAPQAQAATPDAPAAGVRVAMRRETLPPHGKLAEDRPTGERYLFVLSGRLKVSDLVTGDEQIVEAGKMAAERTGDWYAAEALGADPATVYVIDRTPSPAPATASAISTVGASGGD